MGNRKEDSRDETVQLVDQWLKLKAYGLWADWDIKQDDRRLMAAEWFVDQMREFKRYERLIKKAKKKEREKATADYRTKRAREWMDSPDWMIFKNDIRKKEY